jgi:hypothetical protein
MKDFRIEHKKNEHLIFGKTNPIRADEGASRPFESATSRYSRRKISTDDELSGLASMSIGA